jgi:hypothetical protein
MEGINSRNPFVFANDNDLARRHRDEVGIKNGDSRSVPQAEREWGGVAVNPLAN